jgi:hypothetical protein
MCLRVTLRESPAPLGFCNRYVGTSAPGASDSGLPEIAGAAAIDASLALGVLDAEQFATLHVTRVSATIAARRGLAEASLLSASGPRQARAGRTIPVRLRVRVFRGGVKSVRFRLRIPNSARGSLTIRISGPAQSQSSGGPQLQQLGAALASSLGGSGGPGAAGSAPGSLPALTRDFDEVGVYDGLRASVGHGAPVPAYRDPALLIVGRTAFRVSVTR